jgi:integrase
MSRQLSETLRILHTERKRETLAKGWKDVPELVLVNEEGRMINAFNLRPRVFHKGLAKAGLRWIRIHDLRHTSDSLLIQNGESQALTTRSRHFLTTRVIKKPDRSLSLLKIMGSHMRLMMKIFFW